MKQYSDDARVKLTEACEGLELKVYPDPGTDGAPWTAGYGHTGPDVAPGMVVTQALADEWLKADLQHAVSVVNQLVTVPLTQHQFDALVDFTFNCGAGNFKNSTLLRLVNQSQFALADAEFAKWVRAANQVLPGLVKRRKLEAAWFNVPD